MARLLRWAGMCSLLPIVCMTKPRLARDFILRRSFYSGGYSTGSAWVQNEDRADAGHLSGGVADMVRQGMGRRAKTVPVSTSDLLALDQHACAIQPANTPLYSAGHNSKPCPAPLCREDNNSETLHLCRFFVTSPVDTLEGWCVKLGRAVLMVCGSPPLQAYGGCMSEQLCSQGGTERALGH
ncbi:hypothetical protein DPX16_20476 [Anabarilius grahami]|uniref:Uncharacterized protein n=1 Tax=Anabarilius grahami TaxID=495550 RepID=A0A3N0Z4F7_ANAGA|nr:hypothetical protein DPX16_20476 [Anabarilius grahami]